MNVSPHRIRLRAPWRILAGESPDATRYERRFGRPTGLEPGDVVRLVVELADGAAVRIVRVELNGRVLAEELVATGVWDVTDRLASGNELTFRWTPPATGRDTSTAAAPTAATGELPVEIRDVRLEIHAARDRAAPGSS